MHAAVCILVRGDNFVSCILTQFSPLVVMRRNLNMNETQGGINLGGPAGSVSSNLSMLTMIRFDLRLSFSFGFDRLLVTVLLIMLLANNLYRQVCFEISFEGLILR